MTISSVDTNASLVAQAQDKTLDKAGTPDKDTTKDTTADTGSAKSTSDKVSISLAALQSSTSATSGKYYNKMDKNHDGIVTNQEDSAYDLKHGIHD